MVEPKSTIYTILSGIPDVSVFQIRPEEITELPSLTFMVSSNVPTYSLNKEIGYQDIDVTVDIWTQTSIESGALLATLVDTMLENDYRMTFCTDVPDPDNISHIVTRFNLVG